MKNSIVILVGALLVGCGGSGGGDTQQGQEVKKSFDALYVNTADKVIMVVDAARTKGSVIVGDFVGDAVLVSKSAQVESDKVHVKGYTYVDNTMWLSDNTSTALISFSNDVATLTTKINNQNYVYSMTKAKESLLLSEIVGVRINQGDGSVWTVREDGSFQINTHCNLSGTLKRSGFYFDMLAVAENCEDSSMNGQYNGVMLTAEYEGEHYLAGVLMNDSAAIWGSVSL
ncbi:hypothetical protein [Vibrio metschnikovii]|uniref:hypothetical protein n=1 Tax=Vibrio metschnikovii TaxID=28172 RepID=UPI002FCB6405